MSNKAIQDKKKQIDSLKKKLSPILEKLLGTSSSLIYRSLDCSQAGRSDLVHAAFLRETEGDCNEINWQWKSESNLTTWESSRLTFRNKEVRLKEKASRLEKEQSVNKPDNEDDDQEEGEGEEGEGEEGDNEEEDEGSKKKINQHHSNDDDSEQDESEEEEVDDIEELPDKLQPPPKFRKSVSAEAFGLYNKKGITYISISFSSYFLF